MRNLRLPVFALAALCTCGGSLHREADVSDAASHDSHVSPDAPSGDAGTDALTITDSDVTLDAVVVDGAPLEAGVAWPHGALDAAALAPCLDAGYLFYVDSQGYGGLHGVGRITGAEGTWSASVGSLPALLVDVHAAARWAVSVVLANPPLHAGTVYHTSLPTAGIEVVVDGGSCGADMGPTGSFSPVELVGSDSNQLMRLLLWFDLQCPDAGALTGCVSYGN
jgi:hypothetical protein